MVVVEQVVEAKEWEESFTRASTPNEVHYTEAVAEHKSEMNEKLVEHGIEMDMTTTEVWNMKDEQGGPKKAWKWLYWGCSMPGMSLASPVDKF